MKLKSLAVAFVLAVSAYVPVGLAQTTDETEIASPFPAARSESLSDFADVLDPAAEGRIAGLLADVRAETGVHVVVAIMPTIEAYGGQGMRLDAYAKALFNAWGIGDEERNDGILMLVVSDAREVRIALGAGYDAVYDGRAARVLSTAVLPELREGRIEQALAAGITSSQDRLIAPFLAGQPVTVNEGFEEEKSPLLQVLGGLGVFLGGAAFLIRRSTRLRKRCPRCGEAKLTRVREVIEPATLRVSGSGIEHLTCSSCGYVDRAVYKIGRSQSLTSSRTDRKDSASAGSSRNGGSSGSGGFGGGKSSGGGSSEKW